jgi:signal transduction histidine kinase
MNPKKEEKDFGKVREELQLLKLIAQWVAHDLKGATNVLQIASGFMQKDIENIVQAEEILVKMKQVMPEESERLREIFGKNLADLYQGLTTIQSTGHRIVDIANLFSISEDVATNKGHNKIDFDYNEKLKEIFQTYEHYVIKRGLDLRFFHKPGEHKIVMNPSVFSSIVANLVTNSGKYGVRNSTIDFMSEEKKGNLELVIENNVGRVIKEDDLDYIMGYGNRLGEEYDTTEVSQGVGIHLINKIVREGYGGNLRLYSGKRKKVVQDKFKDFNVETFPQDTPVFGKQQKPYFRAKVSLPLRNLS